MVLKWDSQMAMKPIAFDQDDHVRSEDSFLDIAVVSRGGRLNSGWKKVRYHCYTVIKNKWGTEGFRVEPAGCLDCCRASLDHAF